ncbi:aquaporin-2-like [Lytechinus pictus]|uniref:aquaporin-2-like n=1 Tax=Lytechinus pictus TaxID=7653 RepID=UPI0030BA2543
MGELSIPKELQGTLGATSSSSEISSHLAFGIELILTFIYVFVVLSSWELRLPESGYYWPCCRALVIGITYSMNTMWGYAFTQASMNPARSLAAAVITSLDTTLWLVLLEVYVAGPVLGAVLSALIYKYIFATMAIRDRRRRKNERALNGDSSEEENMVVLQNIQSPVGRIKDTRDL